MAKPEVMKVFKILNNNSRANSIIDDGLRKSAKMLEAAGGGRTDGVSTEEGRKERLAWDSTLQYLLMVVSFSVGLGNFWRFPYLTQKHGGGAFLIPYLVMMCIEGIPLLYLELAIGQRMRLGCIGVWHQIHPLLGGLGVTTLVICLVIGVYINTIVVWIYFYLFHSFQSPLPWSSCPTYTTETNETLPVLECDLSDPASYFWYRKALNVSPDIEHSGGFTWKMVACHFLAWSVLYLCVSKGIKSSGKVSYVTALLPYVVLTIFLIRGITLKGSVKGLTYMFTPKISDLLTVRPWLDAASQIFFSLSVGFGGLIAFASYNPIHNNVRRDAVFVGGTNFVMAIFTSTVAFCTIGFKATVMYEHCLDHNIGILEGICSNSNLRAFCDEHNISAPISHELFERAYMDQIPALQNMTKPGQTFRPCNLDDDLNKGVEGAGLIFIVFTQAIREFGPSAPFWSVVFFLMMLSMGMGSMFGAIECLSTGLSDLDLYPWMKKKWLISGLLCSVGCASGMLFMQGSGSYWLEVIDSFVGFYPLILAAIGECLAVAWVYGINRFADEVQFMLGSRPSAVWRLAWAFISPASLLALLIGSIVLQFSEPITYRVYNKNTTLMENAPYPWYTTLVCAVLVSCAVLWIPCVALERKLRVCHYNTDKAFTADRRLSAPRAANNKDKNQIPCV